MPLFDFECPKCNCVEEHIVFSRDEEISILCSKCNKVMKKLVGPVKVSFNFAVETGVWEKDETGQERYKGRGGRKVPVHSDGTPIET